MTIGFMRPELGLGRGLLIDGARLEAAGPVTPNILFSWMRAAGEAGGVAKGERPIVEASVGPGVVGFICLRDKSGELIGSFAPTKEPEARGLSICMNSAERAA